MSDLPRPPPRFVPTLTERVDPECLSRSSTLITPDVQALTNLVRHQIQPIFERRLQEELELLVRSMVTKQRAELSSRLQDEMDLLVRQVVMDAITEQKMKKI